MHAIGFNQPLPITQDNALLDIELPMPTLLPHDILVEIHAISVNPADTKIRQNHTPAQGDYRILGWDAAGIVKAVGEKATKFNVGDEVYYAGAMHRQGAYAEFQAVDERLVSLKPKSLDFAHAAALPLTALTAWETLFDRLDIHKKVSGGADSLLLIGGAGGVGSLTIQLAKALSTTKVIATASRQQSKDWVSKLGADYVIDHHKSLVEQVQALNLGQPSFVFSTTHTDDYLKQIVELICPQGRIALIDDPKTLDVTALKGKSLSLHWEFMFTRSLHQTADLAQQGDILAAVAKLVDDNKIQSTVTTQLIGINAVNLKKAHALVEQGDMIGKVVVSR